MNIKKIKIGGLKTTPLTPVPGVSSPKQQNNATPSKVGSQAVVKTPKPKKMGQATDKPSIFFGKSEFNTIKKSSIEKLRAFLEKQRNKNKI